MPAKSKARKPRASAKAAAANRDLLGRPVVDPSLSHRLQQYRLANGLSYEGLAELIGSVTAETVRRIASVPGHVPSLLTAAKVEKFLADREASHAA